MPLVRLTDIDLKTRLAAAAQLIASDPTLDVHERRELVAAAYLPNPQIACYVTDPALPAKFRLRAAAQHGTERRYSSYGCRCGDCTEAAREARAHRRARKKAA